MAHSKLETSVQMEVVMIRTVLLGTGSHGVITVSSSQLCSLTCAFAPLQTELGERIISEVLDGRQHHTLHQNAPPL